MFVFVSIYLWLFYTNEYQGLGIVLFESNPVKLAKVPKFVQDSYL